MRHHSAVPSDEIRPMRSLGLLSVAHAINHAQAVLLPLIYLAIIDEYGVGVQTIAFLAAFGAFASGVVQLSYAGLTRVVSRRRLLGIGGILFGGGFALQAFATSFFTFAVPNIVSRIGGSPQHPVGNGLLAEQFPADRRGFAISAHIAGGNVGTPQPWRAAPSAPRSDASCATPTCAGCSSPRSWAAAGEGSAWSTCSCCCT